MAIMTNTKKIIAAAFAFFSFGAHELFSQENFPLKMAVEYDNMQNGLESGKFSSDWYYEYSVIQNAFTSGAPGTNEKNTSSQIHSSWVSVLKDFEQYWSKNCPMENYASYSASGPLVRVGQARPGGNVDYSMAVDWQPGKNFLYMKEAIEAGLKKSYNPAWRDVPERWPSSSIYSSEENYGNAKSSGIFLALFGNGARVASYCYESGRTLYYVSYDIIDARGNILFSGKPQRIGRNSKYVFYDVPENVASLVNQGKTSVSVSDLRLHFGECDSLVKDSSVNNMPSVSIVPPRSLTKGRQDDALVESRAKFFSHNKILVSAIYNSDSYTIENELQKYLVRIRGGVFTMGSNKFSDNEFPAHQVKVDSFEIMSIEVPQWLYEAVTGENPSLQRGSGYPAEKISWYKAVKFCNMLSELAGLEPCYSGLNSDSLGGTGNVTVNLNANGYRLPTEAEWEYAARAGDDGVLYSGGNNIERIAVANVSRNRISTQRAASLAPNAWGIYDMSGNVWEWCSDIYGDYKAGFADNPKGSSFGSGYVLKGGCWANTVSRKTGNVDQCRITYRRSENGSDTAFSIFSKDPNDLGNDSIGFRVCRSVR